MPLGAHIAFTVIFSLAWWFIVIRPLWPYTITGKPKAITLQTRKRDWEDDEDE